MFVHFRHVKVTFDRFTILLFCNTLPCCIEELCAKPTINSLISQDYNRGTFKNDIAQYPGAIITWIITLENIGELTLTNTVINDPMLKVSFYKPLIFCKSILSGKG